MNRTNCYQSMSIKITLKLTLITENDQMKASVAAHMDIQHPGDLSSLTWYQLPQLRNSNETTCIDVRCSSLNFRDVMLATGRLSLQAIPGER